MAALSPAMKVIRCFLTATLLAAPSGRAQSAEDDFKDVLPQPLIEKIPDNENAWLLLKDLPPPKYPDSDGTPRKGFIQYPTETADGRIDREFVELTVQSSREAIGRLRKAMQTGGFQLPGPPKHDQDLPVLDQLAVPVRYSQVMLAQAVLHAEKGDTPGAWRDIMDVVKLGSMMAECRTDFTTHGFGTLLQAAGARASVFAAEHVTSSTELKAWAADLAPYEGEQRAFDFLMRHSFAARLHFFGGLGKSSDELKRAVIRHLLMRDGTGLDAADSASPPGSDPVHEKELEQRVERLMQHPTEQIRKEWAAAEGEDVPGQLRGHASFLRLAGKPNLTSQDLFTKSLPDVPGEFSQAERKGFAEGRDDAVKWFKSSRGRISTVRRARTALAIRAWQLDHGGELPERLEQLVPEYLPAVPLDPYDAKPLRYSRERRILWDHRGDPEPKQSEEGKDGDGVMPLVRTLR
jgi:hypothetical protein